MARSTYIYVVMDSGDEVVAAFTVKHELLTWLSSHTNDDYHVWRLDDGARTFWHPQTDRFLSRSPTEITEHLSP